MSEKYPIGTRSESEELVRQWGFQHIFTWTDGGYVNSMDLLQSQTKHQHDLYPISRNRITGLSLAWAPRSRLTPGSNAHYSPHTHSGLTTHLIRRGTLTITYPEDNAELHNGQVKKETFGVGERIDVPAGKVHEVWIGREGCEYVIGE
ncbi:unnamed protein product [Penicillium olsonii]|uniref:Uncharacterized protein n=1 Tax=Penicillium olsonii TaxID=99116 RepID=A0A9W4HRL5_PENOL|nr:unnamed protein product [Penicillium olsonii]CAG8101028.1 unnamed protein product [Penicillium olsonii]CAG8253911.1 unnamed protein product [Penicillium olsonii]